MFFNSSIVNPLESIVDIAWSSIVDIAWSSICGVAYVSLILYLDSAKNRLSGFCAKSTGDTKYVGAPI